MVLADHVKDRLLRPLRRALGRAARAPLGPYWVRALLGAWWPSLTTSRFRSLFVVTYGRSGSTLLTGYLSALPGVRLRGENGLFPVGLVDAARRLTATIAAGRTGDSPTQPWFGAGDLNQARWDRDIRRAVLNQLYPAQPIPPTVGFKEIRWWEVLGPEGFADGMEWLLRFRPPGAVVFLTRDLDAVMASARHAKLPAADRPGRREELARFEEAMQQFAAAHPDNTMILQYEEFIARPEAPRRLCAMLGVPFDERTWRRTLGVSHSYSRNPATGTARTA